MSGSGQNPGNPEPFHEKLLARPSDRFWRWSSSFVRKDLAKAMQDA
ncbi:MAG: hypothetical protein ACR2QJ_06155 [Geminicoccaceae bacterium]